MRVSQSCCLQDDRHDICFWTPQARCVNDTVQIWVFTFNLRCTTNTLIPDVRKSHCDSSRPPSDHSHFFSVSVGNKSAFIAISRSFTGAILSTTGTKKGIKESWCCAQMCTHCYLFMSRSVLCFSQSYAADPQMHDQLSCIDEAKAWRLPIWLSPLCIWLIWISTLFWKELKKKPYHEGLFKGWIHEMHTL